MCDATSVSHNITLCCYLCQVVTSAQTPAWTLRTAQSGTVAWRRTAFVRMLTTLASTVPTGFHPGPTLLAECVLLAQIAGIVATGLKCDGRWTDQHLYCMCCGTTLL